MATPAWEEDNSEWDEEEVEEVVEEEWDEEDAQHREKNAEAEECDDEELGLDWDGDDVAAAAAAMESDAAFETLNAENDQDGFAEEELLADLREDLARLFPGYSFELEPFGSYVTNLGLPKSEEGARSDLDVVLLIHGESADSVDDKSIRERLVRPTLTKLGNFLRTKDGIVVRSVILRSRVPIVTFDTTELSVDVSVQQPWGVLNSWHLKDLCESGWPGRLRALVRMVKRWAQSKSINTAKDGALSSYGYSLLAAAFLREVSGLPALLPKGSKVKTPYLDDNSALKLVLSSCKDGRVKGRGRANYWKAPAPVPADGSEEASCSPPELFAKWLDWMGGTVLKFAGKLSQKPTDCGWVPLEQRHIVSVRPRSQAQLREDVGWSQKFNEHWNTYCTEVFMVIEEPLNGENVGRPVRLHGLTAIREEVFRARKEFKKGTAEEAFKRLCELPPSSSRSQEAGGAARGCAPHEQGVKRPWEDVDAWGSIGGPGAFAGMGGAAASQAAKRWRAAAANVAKTGEGKQGGLSSAKAFGARALFAAHGKGGW